jgi:hypothetical protein
MDPSGKRQADSSTNDSPAAPKCPNCQSPVPTSGIVTVCHRCGGALPELPRGPGGRLLLEQPAEPTPAEAGEDAKPGIIARVLRTAGYGASLPERFVRSLAAGLGGVVKETAELALPDLLKRTTIYSILLDRALRFIVEDVGQVEGVYDADEEQAGFVVRKIVGNFVELAGLLTLQASPLWVLALVGDAAFGIRTYLDLLVEELKAKEILEEGETIESASALLGRLERLSATGALAIDLPPMALKDLKDMAGRVSREAKDGVRDARAFREQADKLLEPMRQVAKKEKVSLFDVSAVVGMQAARTVSVTTAALGAGARLLNEQVFAHYADAIKQMRDRGFYTALRESYTPYTTTVAEHFRPGHQTLTDQLLSGELFRKPRPDQSGPDGAPEGT